MAPAPASDSSLGLFCDLRFVAADAKLTTAAPKLGLPAEYGASWMLPRIVGVTRANDLLLSGHVVTGDETADWGLWNGVEPDGESTLVAAEHASAGSSPTRSAQRGDGMTKHQIADDLLRHDPAASVADSLRLLDQAMGTAGGTAKASARRSPRNAPELLSDERTTRIPAGRSSPTGVEPHHRSSSVRREGGCRRRDRALR